jgi:glycerol-3-phosphate dehydrogenase
VDEASLELLAGRYGYAAHDVLALLEERPELGRRIVPELPDLLVEAPFAARNEQAQSVADVLLRRTRLGILAAPALTAPDSEPARAVAEALGAELGWDSARVDRELEAWHEVARAERVDVNAEPVPVP